jgi:hypothetical protein
VVLTISEEEFLQMKAAVMDRDHEEAFRLVKLLARRLEQQERQGLKCHLDGQQTMD